MSVPGGFDSLAVARANWRGYVRWTDSACPRPQPCLVCARIWLDLEAAGIALDTATAEAISGDDTPGAGPTWSQRWRTRQAAIWADALHRTLLKSVAY